MHGGVRDLYPVRAPKTHAENSNSWIPTMTSENFLQGQKPTSFWKAKALVKALELEKELARASKACIVGPDRRYSVAD